MSLALSVHEFKPHFVSITIQWSSQIGVTYNIIAVPAVNITFITVNSSANMSLLYNTVYNVSIIATSICGPTTVTSVDLYYGEQNVQSLLLLVIVIVKWHICN